MDIAALQLEIDAFAEARDWRQFHNPKNLAAALSVEASELLEIFQWLTPEQGEVVMQNHVSAEAVRDEVADVMVYLLRLTDILGIDLEAAVRAKMLKNAVKHPAP